MYGESEQHIQVPYVLKTINTPNWKSHFVHLTFRHTFSHCTMDALKVYTFYHPNSQLVWSKPLKNSLRSYSFLMIVLTINRVKWVKNFSVKKIDQFKFHRSFSNRMRNEWMSDCCHSLTYVYHVIRPIMTTNFFEKWSKYFLYSKNNKLRERERVIWKRRITNPATRMLSITVAPTAIPANSPTC